MKRMAISSNRKRPRGASLVELGAAMLVLVCLGISLLDLTPLVLAASICDGTAKTAARIAANQTEKTASQAAQAVVSSVALPPIMPLVTMAQFDYNAGKGTVTILLSANVYPPLKVPLLEKQSFVIQTKAIEAIVAQ